ncbi:hypothetical protein ACN28S_08585 [Cystobacter fuscus]
MAHTQASHSGTGRTWIILNEGRWKTSLMMTVATTRLDGTASCRVFTFDPETQVGNGTN